MQVLKILGGRLWPDYIKRTLFMDASRFKKDQDLLGMFEAAVAMQGSQPTSSLIAFKHYDKTRTIQKEARKAAKRIHGHGRDGVAPGAREGLQIQVLVRLSQPCKPLRLLAACAVAPHRKRTMSAALRRSGSAMSPHVRQS